MIYFKKCILYGCGLFFGLNLFVIPAQALDNSRNISQNKDIRLYYEAITEIEKNAYKELTKYDIVRESLKSYLKDLDTFSDYLDREEYDLFKKSQSSRYVGLGMDILRNSSDQIVCLPYPESPAQKAGIRYGDILKAIDGEDISGKSFYSIGVKTKGKEGTEVLLTIIDSQGLTTDVKVKRSVISRISVTKKLYDNIPVITIRAFTKDTQSELRDILTSLDKRSPIVIDIRGNTGGNLHTAIHSAMLFLEKEKKVVAVKTAHETNAYISNGTFLVNAYSPLYIFQDDKTASAAEVFLAALTQNNRAQSIGIKTYGKGTTQKVIELSDGSALILTTGYLQSPDGTIYHEKGFEPTYALHNPLPEITHYLEIVKKLINKKIANSEKVLPERERDE